MSFPGYQTFSFGCEASDLDPALIPPPTNFKPYLPNRVWEVREANDKVPLIPEYVNVYTNNFIDPQVPSRLSQTWYIGTVASPEKPSQSLSATPSAVVEEKEKDCDPLNEADLESNGNLEIKNPYYTSAQSLTPIPEPRQNKVETKKHDTRLPGVPMERATDRIYTPLKGNKVRDFVPTIPWPYSGVAGSGELFLRASLQSDEGTASYSDLQSDALYDSQPDSCDSQSNEHFDEQSIEGIEGQNKPQLTTDDTLHPWFPIAINPGTGLWTPFIVTGVSNGETMVAFGELEQLEDWLDTISKAPPGQAHLVGVASLPFRESMLPPMSRRY